MRQIALEMCPTSNVLTRAVRSLADHPVDRYLRLNLPVTVNTDSRTTCDTTMTQEYHKLVHEFGWGLEQIKRTVLTAADCAFLPDDQRAELHSGIHRHWPRT
jgi:adenosine deaminase